MPPALMFLVHRDEGGQLEAAKLDRSGRDRGPTQATGGAGKPDANRTRSADESGQPHRLRHMAVPLVSDGWLRIFLPGIY